MKKVHTLLLAFLSCSTISLAQNGLGFGQYVFNSHLINPAYFNRHSPFSCNLDGRYQWADYQKSPNTIGFSGLYNIQDHHTVGLTLFNDRIAVFNTFQAAASYAYRLNLGKKVQMGFGVKVGYSNQSNTFNRTDLTDPTDPMFNMPRSVGGLSLGAGIYIAGERFAIGIGAPSLFNNRLMMRGFSPSVVGSSYYVTAGVKVVKQKNLMFYPSLLLSAVQGAPIHGQLDLNFLVMNGLWLSAGASTNIGANISVGWLFESGFRVVYSYGFSFGKFNKYGSGMHEITLGYTKDLFENKFAQRKYTTRRGGKFQSFRKQHRRYK